MCPIPFVNLTNKIIINKTTPYDPELLENWTINRLREELNNPNIRPPPNDRRMALVRLLSDSRSIDDVSIGDDSMGDSHDTSVNEASARSHNATQNVNNEHRTAILIDLVSNIQNLQQNVISLNNKCNSLSNSNSVTNNVSASRNANLLPNPSFFTTTPATSVVTPSSSSQSFTMESALHNLQSSPMIRGESKAREFTERNMRGYVRTTYGYAAESLPLVETISPQLRQNITAGRNVNLAARLIPYYTAPVVTILTRFRIKTNLIPD